jgi:hypothetical protein
MLAVHISYRAIAVFVFGKPLFINKRYRIYVCYTNITIYRVIRNDCRGFNNLSYTIHLRQQYVVALMDQEILKIFFYDVRCAVVMHY